MSSERTRRPNGRFVRKKKLLQEVNSVINMNKKKEFKRLDEKSSIQDKRSVEVNSVVDGFRFVDVQYFAQKMKCTKCLKVLDLDNIISEKVSGAHSIFQIKCIGCDTQNIVPTSQMQKTDNGSYAESNLALVLGAIHSGVGYTGLKKLMSCLNIPGFSNVSYKRYEEAVGKAIEKVAVDSCTQAAEEEKRLVLSNIKKLCENLPPEISISIFPFLNQIDLCEKNSETGQPANLPDASFYAGLADIVNIIVSFDMGWSKRGNGRNYDSLNGYATIIGYLSNKILDYATRNRSCAKCDKGDKNHDNCRLNFKGSAKAMEADAGLELITNSKVLKNVGLHVSAVVGDDDSSMIASVRKASNTEIHKLSDRNHLIKHFTSDLYKLAEIYKELKKKNYIDHLKKCFSYAVVQNKGNSIKIASILKALPHHLYNEHENCQDWCSRLNGTMKQTVILRDENLRSPLIGLFEKYASNAKKFSIAASSQSNESFNNIVAHKAAKNICYSKSASCDYRVADAVCTYNDKEYSILKIKKKLKLPLGRHTVAFVNGANNKREQRASLALTKRKKLRRLQLKSRRQLLRKKNESTEGVKYTPNCGINNADTYVQDNIVSTRKIECDSVVVFFDLETSGLNNDADILQISAKSKNMIFNTYITPLQDICSSASKITGLCNNNSALYLNDIKLTTCSQHEALISFLEFLKKISNRCLLVAHNVSFDKPRLLRLILKFNMQKEFEIINGFCDTLSIFKKILPDRKGTGMFKLSKLAEDFNIHEQDNESSFHDAEYDVKILEKLACHLQIEEKLFEKAVTYGDSILQLQENYEINAGLQKLSDLKNLVSRNILKKIAKTGVSSELLVDLYKKEGEMKFCEFFSEKVDGKPRITNNKKVLNKIIIYVRTYDSPKDLCV